MGIEQRHGLGLRVTEPVPRVPSRLPKPQGAGPFRGTACRRWPAAAAATRTWGRARGGDQATRLLRLGSPRGRRAGKSQARVQERGARPGGRPGRWRSAPAMSQGLQLLLLGCACSLAPAMAMREVTVACSETADLPCTAPWDPQLSYAVSWVKLSESGNERLELPQSRQNSSFEAPRKKSYSLTIQNTTLCSSGTYRCALQELGGQRNLSGTVVLKDAPRKLRNQLSGSTGLKRCCSSLWSFST
ncbi:CD83 antigen isoform X2 [Meriones unguiculatus]|uniref:CD83 antigen isoform X2 n=1 Tax=Meriones unguiculatus TaxID=10047 RepID=UPI00293F08E4|nr:CD83 antigen isoform X2 [Meriones unguiculatus]